MIYNIHIYIYILIIIIITSIITIPIITTTVIVLIIMYILLVGGYILIIQPNYKNQVGSDRVRYYPCELMDFRLRAPGLQ